MYCSDRLHDLLDRLTPNNDGVGQTFERVLQDENIPRDFLFAALDRLIEQNMFDPLYLQPVMTRLAQESSLPSSVLNTLRTYRQYSPLFEGEYYVRLSDEAPPLESIAAPESLQWIARHPLTSRETLLALAQSGTSRSFLFERTEDDPKTFNDFIETVLDQHPYDIEYEELAANPLLDTLRYRKILERLERDESFQTLLEDPKTRRYGDLFCGLVDREETPESFIERIFWIDQSQQKAILNRTNVPASLIEEVVKRGIRHDVASNPYATDALLSDWLMTLIQNHKAKIAPEHLLAIHSVIIEAIDADNFRKAPLAEFYSRPDIPENFFFDIEERLNTFRVDAQKILESVLIAYAHTEKGNELRNGLMNKGVDSENRYLGSFIARARNIDAPFMDFLLAHRYEIFMDAQNAERFFRNHETAFMTFFLNASKIDIERELRFIPMDTRFDQSPLHAHFLNKLLTHIVESSCLSRLNVAFDKLAHWVATVDKNHEFPAEVGIRLIDWILNEQSSLENPFQGKRESCLSFVCDVLRKTPMPIASIIKLQAIEEQEIRLAFLENVRVATSLIAKHFSKTYNDFGLSAKNTDKGLQAS